MEENNKFKSLLNFEYSAVSRAQPSIADDDIFELYYEGRITKLFEPDYPINIGLFNLDILNLRAARKFGQYDELISNTLKSDFDINYDGLYDILMDLELNFDNVDRIINLNSLIIHPKYRGKDILPEIIKSIYLSHYHKNTLLIVNARPIQSLDEDYLEYYNDYNINVSVDGKMNIIGGIAEKQTVSVGEYYRLDELPTEDEGHFYKLYAKMLKLKLTQMKSTSFFYYKNERDILEMIKQNKFDALKFM